MLYLCEEYDRLSVVLRMPFIRFAGKAVRDLIKWMVSKEDKYTAAGVEHLARIRLDWEKTQLSISQMEEYAQELKQMAGEVDDVRGNLRFKILSSDIIASTLRLMSERLTGAESSVRMLGSSLSAITNMYRNTERGIFQAWDDSAELKQAADAYDNTTQTFDDNPDNGTYGADQGDMANNKKGIWFFGFRWFEDEDLYAYIRQHSRYQDYSQTEIAELMDQINSEGCGYAAMVNNIFVEYEGREEEFERVFGFPMYDKDGRANYNYLLVDFYACTDDKYYLDEAYGAASLVNDVILEYLGGREDEFREKYGCDPVIKGENGENLVNPEARQKILDEYQDQSVVTMEGSGTTEYSLENRFRHYMEQKDVECSVETLDAGAISGGTIDQYLDEGKSVNISVDGFNLYREDGTAAAVDVGGHWMTITGTTEDGRYIVSSWGGRYFLNPSELNNPSFFITDIYV